MNNKVPNRTIISKALLFLFLFLQVFAVIHISSHKIDFEISPVYSQEETDPLHDSDYGCIMLQFLSLNQEDSISAVYFTSYLSVHLFIVPPQSDDYVSAFLLNCSNRAPPLFS